MPRLIEPVVPPGSMCQLLQPELDVDDQSYLRPWSPEDASVVVAAYEDPDIQWWMPYSYDEVEAKQVISSWTSAWANETGASWAIAKRSDHSAFGRFAFQTIDFISGSADLVYWILPNSRGQGFAPRATTALCQWAFDQVGLHRVQLFHSVRNSASCRVALKAGLGLEATLRSEAFYRDGWHDTHLHALIRTESTPSNQSVR